MVENSFEGNIRFFIFYIIPINYAIYMDQNLIFGPSWIQNTIVPFFFLSYFPNTSNSTLFPIFKFISL